MFVQLVAKMKCLLLWEHNEQGSNVPEFIEPEIWPPNSPALNPMVQDYSVCVWGGQMVYRHEISDTDKVK